MIGTRLLKDGLDYELKAIEPYEEGTVFPQWGLLYHFVSRTEENGYGVERLLCVQVKFTGRQAATGQIPEEQLERTGLQRVREAFAANFQNVPGLTTVSDAMYRIEMSLDP